MVSSETMAEAIVMPAEVHPRNRSSGRECEYRALYGNPT